MRYIPMSAVEPDMILAMSIYDSDANVLLHANSKLTNNYIARLQSLGYNGLYIYDGQDLDFYNSIISEETRAKTLKNLKHLNIDSCLFLANKITDEVLSSDSMTIDMITISSYDNYIYVHSVNVTVYAVICGTALGLRNDELKLLAQAALLHDIGKTAIDSRILNKPGYLTPDEYTEIQKHSEYGYQMLQHNQDVASVVRNAVYSHHENEDGTGYPRHLTSDKIQKLAKIIHVCDVYDAMVSKRTYKDIINPATAIEYLMAHTCDFFNETVVKAFISHVAPYAIGTTVELSNGELAIILKNHATCLGRPIIRILDSENQELDLMNELNITIIGLAA